MLKVLRLLAVSTLIVAMGIGCAPSTDSERESDGEDDLFVDTDVIWTSGEIPVCWLNPQDPTAMEWVRSAVENSWATASGVRFTGWDTCPSVFSGVRIRIEDSQPRSAMGTRARTSNPSMWLNFTFNTWSTGCRSTRGACIRAIAVHEFGHALGFDHEQNSPLNPPNDGCVSDVTNFGGDEAAFGVWDLSSTMNYCNPEWINGGELSPTDALGAQIYYGPPGGWGACSARLTTLSKESESFGPFASSGTLLLRTFFDEEPYEPFENEWNRCQWTAVSSASWLTVTPPSGIGAQEIRISASLNPGAKRSATVQIAGRTVTIEQAAAGVPATFDAGLGAPRCGTVGPSCGSGVLLNGRGTLGPESNAPNTLRRTCADGTSGAYRFDESNEAIQIFTTDGSPLTAGKPARIEVGVWAFDANGGDHLDLYHTTNAEASTPAWTFLTTMRPTIRGLSSLSFDYVLPSGSNQAVRAQFRFGAVGETSSGPCMTGVYNDRDDLVFAVLTPVCGDGRIEGVEQCDDANISSNDGCSSSCTIESGWRCVVAATPCTTLCGDGLRRGNEACDDGSDGCSGTCQVVPGWTCPLNAACSPICGDGQVVGNEGCDDGNLIENDGCSSTCDAELGWLCNATGCSSVCGDGYLRGAEECDDRNVSSNDGCSSTCAIEVGWACGTPGIPCTGIAVLVPGYVRASLTLRANVNVPFPVLRVDFYRGATRIGYDTTAPYSYPWNTLSPVVSGSMVITARAIGANTSMTSVGVSVVVDNTRPITSITAPAAGAVTGTVDITASATDTISGVDRVNFYRGTVLMGSVTAPPYLWSWNTSLISNGAYSLTVRAYDRAGNVTISVARAVTVLNELVTNGGFEDGVSGWNLVGNAIVGNTIGAAYVGSQYAQIGGNNLTGSFDQSIAIPSYFTRAYLSFRLKVVTQEVTTTLSNDRLAVEAISATGAVTRLATFSNLHRGTTYVLRPNYNLLAYRGRIVTVRFRSLVNTTRATTFYIDQVTLK